MGGTQGAQTMGILGMNDSFVLLKQYNTYNLIIFRMMKKMMTTRRMTVKRVNMLKIQSLKRTQIRFLM